MSLRRILFYPCGCLLIAMRLMAQSPAPPSQPSSSTPASPSSSSSSSSKARTKSQPAGAAPRLDSGSISGAIYRNFSLGVTCKIPSGWVLRTADMNASDEDGADANSRQKAADPTQARVLLAAFSRPPEARGEDVNGSILIAAESASSYPGLKEAAQYFVLVTEIAKAQGFEMQDEPYQFVVGTKTLARGDYQKDVGSRVMRQSTLVMLARGYVVSFTFIGGTEDDVEELVQGLSLTAAKATR